MQLVLRHPCIIPLGKQPLGGRQTLIPLLEFQVSLPEVILFSFLGAWLFKSLKLSSALEVQGPFLVMRINGILMEVNVICLSYEILDGSIERSTKNIQISLFRRFIIQLSGITSSLSRTLHIKKWNVSARKLRLRMQKRGENGQRLMFIIQERTFFSG